VAKRKAAAGGKVKDKATKAGSDGGTGKRQGDPEALLLSTVTGDSAKPGKQPPAPVHDRGSGKRQGDSEGRLVKRVARKTKAKP
jgi:hypothetical protein